MATHLSGVSKDRERSGMVGTDIKKEDDVMPTKMKDDPDWFSRPLMSRIACVLYPGLCDDETKKQMRDIAQAKGKKSPQQMADELRNKR